ncbi:sperm flagellar protein 1-like isoform X3 [Crassostrea virginica]|uniref:Sperm flagellar protein 1-like isoform X3 n=1 Tax=Crassostrea virginica TaxID=6565 RepID=A0A8B8EZD7_CRAVI|nr:sperm flagellar protein 1-like isoform X3 [Crassostrea virginica]
MDKSGGTNMAEFDDAELEELYNWVDSIPLSRPKKNIARDFSDGVLVAEIIQSKFPTLVELHNYSQASATDKKMLNWAVLNRKVLSKLNFTLSDEVIREVVTAKPGVIEKVLLMLRLKLERAEWELTKQPQQSKVKAKGGRRGAESDKPEADQYMGTPGRGFAGKKSHSPTRGGGFQMTSYQYAGHYEPSGYMPDYYPDQSKSKGIHRVDGDYVSRLLFEEKVQESLSKDETIKILQAKINRMEHLIHLKDVRIDDLQNRVETMRPTGNLVRR